MAAYDVDVVACRGRQKQLLECMSQLGLDLAIVVRPEHVQWLTGARFAWMFETAAALAINGHMTLVAPIKAPDVAAADEILTYEAKTQSTFRNDQRAVCSEVLWKALVGRSTARTFGVEFSSFPPSLAAHFSGPLGDLEPDLYRLRRRKDADELALIKKGIAATGKMYLKAREMVVPGVNELDVFNALQTAAVRECGEMLTQTGNDYQCAARGGPPRDRRANEGELYILDLGPAFRGYFSDNCRTLSVGGKPSERQQQAWHHVSHIFGKFTAHAKAGVRCRELYEEARVWLQAFPDGLWNSHLGHGIGLYPHEAPHLNPHWDDVLEVGDVIAVEPAVYAPDLKYGIRIENNYLVKADSVELLSDFPMEL